MNKLNYLIKRAEKDLNNGFGFSVDDFNSIINQLKRENEEYEPITWEEMKDELLDKGHYYCYWQDTFVNDREEAKELGWIDEDDLDDDEYDEYIESLEIAEEEYNEYVESELLAAEDDDEQTRFK